VKVHEGKGQYEQAEAAAREALTIRQALTGNEHPLVAESLDQLAGVLEKRGQYKEAEARAEEGLAIRRRTLGPRDERVADSLKTLATVVASGAADYARSEKLLLEELDIRRATTTGDHVKTAMALNDLAVNYFRLENYEKAEALYRDSLAMQRRVLGDEHPEVAATLENLGGVYYRTKRYDETLGLLDQVLAMRRKRLGDNHTAVGRTLHNIGAVKSAAGDYAGAVAALTEGERRLRSTLGGTHPELMTALVNLADALKGTGALDDAEDRYKQALAIGLAGMAADHPDIARTRRQLGTLLVAARRFGEAETQLLAAADAREKRLGRDHATTKAAAEDVARMYDAWGKPEQAAAWRTRPGGR
jgi:tetratricopeptide (TPR) repeat protein